jgi:hypothetical protein
LLVNALLSEGYAQHIKIAIPIDEEFCLYSYSGGQLELVNSHGFQYALFLGVVLIVGIGAPREGSRESLRSAYDEKQLAVAMLARRR